MHTSIIINTLEQGDSFGYAKISSIVAIKYKN